MKEMTLEEHLAELRVRLMRILVIMAFSFMACYAFGEKLSEILLLPLREVLLLQTSGKIVYLGLLDKVLSQLQVALWSSIILSSPLWFREIWFFIKPGLYEKEKKVIRPFIFISFLLFWLGITFGLKLVFPFTFKTLLQFGVGDVEAYLGLKEYLGLSLKVLLCLGVIFQVPNILLILGFMGVVTKYSLRNMRRYIYVILAVVSALLTPPDVITMITLWFPLVLLFELGILAVAVIVHPYLKKANGFA